MPLYKKPHQDVDLPTGAYHFERSADDLAGMQADDMYLDEVEIAEIIAEHFGRKTGLSVRKAEVVIKSSILADSHITQVDIDGSDVMSTKKAYPHRTSAGIVLYFNPTDDKTNPFGE